MLNFCISVSMIEEESIDYPRNQSFLSHTEGVIGQYCRLILNRSSVRDSHLNPNHDRFLISLMKVGLSFYQRNVLQCVVIQWP